MLSPLGIFNSYKLLFNSYDLQIAFCRIADVSVLVGQGQPEMLNFLEHLNKVFNLQRFGDIAA